MARLRSERDGLLELARVLLLIIRIMLWVGMAALAVAIPAVFWQRALVAAQIGAAGDLSPLGVAAMLGGLMALALVNLFLATRFIRPLLAIIASVAGGDPFARINAARLRTMAWLLLAIQVGSAILGGYAAWVASHFPTMDRNFDVSVGTLIAALLLFILARVFERGADMREELEGTV